MRYSRPVTRLFPLSALLALAAPAPAYIEAPMTLADVINQSAQITILRVTRVDKSKNLIVYEKVEDIKGKFPTATARHVCTGQLKAGQVPRGGAFGAAFDPRRTGINPATRWRSA